MPGRRGYRKKTRGMRMVSSEREFSLTGAVRILRGFK